ncbi:hypothetical protein [Streptomyces sp. SDr-06]|uniref:hypothetical protein n=1 Tax=Streptomyces sp. SDr-06 TaxID=2267702 RepID=UPI0011C06634|nr:hypothetical protein [Streptomyces sp. SDr-06]
MDSGIVGGPGGQPRPDRSEGGGPPRDATVRLGFFAEQLSPPAHPLGKPDPRLSVPRPRAAEPEPVQRSATQKIPVFKPLRAASAERAVFVDASGRRGKKIRWLGWIFGLAATGFAVALVGSLLGGSARAPGLNLPEGSKADSVTAPPQAAASQPPSPKASSTKKALTPVHSPSKAPSAKASRSEHGATPATGHSPVRSSPHPSASHKPSARAASLTVGATGA